MLGALHGAKNDRPPRPFADPPAWTRPRRYSCAEPNDTRFRAAARLRQSLCGEQQGYTCGRYVDAKGRSRRLGSRVTDRIGRTGINLVYLILIPLVQREIAYREVGAFILCPSAFETTCSPARRSPSACLAPASSTLPSPRP